MNTGGIAKRLIGCAKIDYHPERCIGCGLCQEICPCGAITLSGGKPAWTKSKCVQCLGCLHRCPTQAIHWKKADEHRGRYYNPRVEP